MRSTSFKTQSSSKGFTLLEILIVVVIIAILAAIALPSYLTYVVRTQRGEALRVANEITAMLGRHQAVTYRYDRTPSGAVIDTALLTGMGLDRAPVETSATQTHSIVFATPPTATAYRLDITRVDTRDPNCVTMTLSSTGARTASPGSVAECWTH